MTVSNVAHQRESRARQRSHQERVGRHGQHRGHVPSPRHGLFTREVRVRSPSEQRGRRVGLSREDCAGRPKRQDHGLEVGDLHTLRGTLLAVEERSKSDSQSGVRVRLLIRVMSRERSPVESRQEEGMPDGIGPTGWTIGRSAGRSAVGRKILGINLGGL